jgi:flagellar hook-length control protein FliK
MQTTNLPLQLNTALTGNTAATRANAANAGADAGQFSAMLSTQLAQIQAPAPMPAPQGAPQASAAPKQDATKPAQASQPAQSDDTPAPEQSSSTQDAARASDGAKQAQAGDKADAKSDDDSDAAQKNADPANAMLALIASLQHPFAKTATTTARSTAQAFDALGGKAGRGDAAQLAALQGLVTSAGKDSAGADAKDLSATSGKDAALAESGVALGADAKAGANAATDLSAALAGAGLKTEPKTTLDAAELSLQQARDAAQQVAQQDPSAMAAAALAQTTQPAALDAAQAAGASEQLSAQVGTDAWENQVGQKVVYMIGNEEQTASLTLNPPDLGPMQVVLSVSNDQASVTFSANQEEVRKALEDALPRLREMMSESGIALGNATVNAGTQDQQRQAQQDSSPRGGRNYGSADGVTGTDTAAPRVTRTTLLGDNGLVDTFA